MSWRVCPNKSHDWPDSDLQIPHGKCKIGYVPMSTHQSPIYLRQLTWYGGSLGLFFPITLELDPWVTPTPFPPSVAMKKTRFNVCFLNSKLYLLQVPPENLSRINHTGLKRDPVLSRHLNRLASIEPQLPLVRPISLGIPLSGVTLPQLDPLPLLLASRILGQDIRDRLSAGPAARAKDSLPVGRVRAERGPDQHARHVADIHDGLVYVQGLGLDAGDDLPDRANAQCDLLLGRPGDDGGSEEVAV